MSDISQTANRMLNMYEQGLAEGLLGTVLVPDAPITKQVVIECYLALKKHLGCQDAIYWIRQLLSADDDKKITYTQLLKDFEDLLIEKPD